MKTMILKTQRTSRYFCLMTVFILLIFTGCDSGGGEGGGGEAPLVEEDLPANNKAANFLLTLAPQGGDQYLLIVGITDAVPGTSVKQSNAQNIFTGTVNGAGLYQKEHAVYEAGSGEVTVIVTVTDPEGEVLIKELKKKIPAKELGLSP